MTLSAAEFIRRFMLHVLPPGICKIRHFGIFASRDKSARMNLYRKLTATSFCPPKPASTLDTLQKMLGQDFDRCPALAAGLAVSEPLPPVQRYKRYNFYLPLHWGGGDYALFPASVFYICCGFASFFDLGL